MKRILAFCLSLSLVALGQNPSYTPNFGFELPAYGTTNWQVPLNYNFNLLDKILAGNSSIALSTWNISTTYNVGNLVIYNGTGYISLADANTGNIPTNATWWTNSLGTTSANTISSSMVSGCLPLANGANSLIASLFCDNGTTGSYSGTGGFSIPSSSAFIIGPDSGIWRVGAATFSFGSATSSSYGGSGIIAGSATFGTLLVSGPAQMASIQAGTPGASLVINEAGGGPLTLTVNGGLSVNGAIYANSSYGIAGYVLSSNGPGSPVSWVANTAGGTTNTLCSGQISLGTSAIASGAAATVVTATCSTLAVTDNIQLDFAADPTSTTGYTPSVGGMLTIVKYPTSNTINVKVVNNTASSITPGAVTMNYRVVR